MICPKCLRDGVRYKQSNPNKRKKVIFLRKKKRSPKKHKDHNPEIKKWNRTDYTIICKKCGEVDGS